MKKRKEAAALIRKQLNNDHEAYKDKKTLYHYGRIELRELMDFIYGGSPSTDDEKIFDD